MKRTNILLIFLFGIASLPTNVISQNIKFSISILFILFLCITEKNLKITNISIFRNLFDISIYLYLFGIIIGGIANEYLSLTIIYCGIYFLRHVSLKSLSNKIDVIKIYDAAVIGVTSQILIGYVFDPSSRKLILRLLRGSISGIASNRLQMWGQTANFLGITVGLILAYIIVRIVIDQYKICNLNYEKKGYIQFNSKLGYLIFIINALTLFLTNTRAAYIGIFIGIVPLIYRVIKSNGFKKSIYNKYYISLIFLIVLNIRWVYKIFSEYVLLQNDPDRGLSSGLTGRFDIWGAKLNSLGPIGHGYKLSLFDNNYLYAVHLSGFLFALPMFFMYFYFCFKTFFGFRYNDGSDLKNFEFLISMPLSLYMIIMLFFDQQTNGLTSVISYFFPLIPFGIIPNDD